MQKASYEASRLQGPKQKTQVIETITCKQLSPNSNLMNINFIFEKITLSVNAIFFCKLLS